jgi:hypothetical protein
MPKRWLEDVPARVVGRDALGTSAPEPSYVGNVLESPTRSWSSSVTG